MFDAEGKEPYLFIAVQDVLLTAHGGWDKVADSTRFVTFILKLRNDRTEKNVIDGGKASLHFDDGWEDADLYKDAFWPKPKGDWSAEIVVVGQGHDVRNKAIVIERGVPQIFAATFVFSGGSGDDPWPDFSNRQFELKLTDGFGRSYRRSGITPTSLKENLTFL